MYVKVFESLKNGYQSNFQEMRMFFYDIKFLKIAAKYIL